jgi:hypothetical protein
MNTQEQDRRAQDGRRVRGKIGLVAFGCGCFDEAWDEGPSERRGRAATLASSVIEAPASS